MTFFQAAEVDKLWIHENELFDADNVQSSLFHIRWQLFSTASQPNDLWAKSHKCLSFYICSWILSC